jgi:hypothetical protein
VGDRDGETVGIVDGIKLEISGVGIVDGDAVGRTEGRAVCFGVVRDIVSEEVGLIDGIMLGASFVGEIVGKIIGEADRTSGSSVLGNLVGEAVGIIDGIECTWQ